MTTRALALDVLLRIGLHFLRVRPHVLLTQAVGLLELFFAHALTLAKRVGAGDAAFAFAFGLIRLVLVEQFAQVD